MSNLNKEIKLFVEEYFRTYFTERDFEKMKTFLSPEMTGIGTGLNEYGDSPEETFLLYEKDLKEVTTPIKYTNEKVKITFLSTDISTVMGVLFIQGDVDGKLFTVPDLRYTMTLRKEKGSWKILQFHMSTPNDQQEKDELYPLQKLSKLNKLLNKTVDERTKELKITNEKLVKSNNTKETLLSIISHDLRNPFNSLLGFIEILKTQYEKLNSDSHKKYIKIISDSSNKVFVLLDNLLTWSNLQRNGFEFCPTSIDLQKTVFEIVTIFKEQLEEKQISIFNKIEESTIVLGDKFMLSTILRNLISNSLKFTPNNGTITISISHQNTLFDDEITVCIQDTGVGIPLDKMNSLFKPGFHESTKGTNQEIGTGLGLSLCKEFIDIHGTKIWGESTPEVGSTFYFNIKKI